MKRISLFFSLMLLSIIAVSAQTYIRDIDSKEPIPYARVLNHQGMVIAVSDINGKIPQLHIKDKPISIEHIAYQTKKLTAKGLKQDILLKEKSIELNQCLVTAKKADYIRLRTYFRSAQLNDSIMKYATEGVMDFYIKLSNHKVKSVLRVEAEYKNRALIAKDKKRANMVVDKYIAQPYLEKRTLLELCRDKKKYSLNDSIGLVYKKNIEMGLVSRDSLRKVCRVDYDNLAEYGGERSTTLFGYTTRLAKVLGTETFLLKSSTPSYKDLLNRLQYRMIYYKHKKDEHWQRCEITDELYVLDRALLTKEEMKEESNNPINIEPYKDKIQQLALPPLPKMD